jgi:ubiquinone/menaquinone biosynthesis C-methylase UbiE
MLMQTKPGPDAKPPVTPERLMQYAFGYAAPLMLEAAVRHRIFDLLDGGPRTIDQLTAATGTSERGLRILLNGLVGMEMLAKDAQGRYSLTPESSIFLVSGKPGYRGGFFKHTSSQLIPKWLKLTDIVRTGKPAIAVNQEGEGAQFFLEFVEDLFPINQASARILGEHLNVPAATKPVSVLDLAAGSGVWGIAIAQLSPHVRVTAVDWPGVLPATRRTAEREGVADRCRFVGGDLLEVDFGSGHQIATLGHILHSEGVERSRALLKKTFAALAPGGTIAIAEWLVNDERTGPPPGLMFAVNMLVNTEQGDTFTFNEIRRWLEEAGFRDVRTLEVPSVSPLVLATK